MPGRLFLIVAILTASFSVFWWATSTPVTAATYGSGNYGDCVYGGELGNNALSFAVNTSNVTMSPALSDTTTATGLATFDVELGCSDLGYVVTIDGGAPSSGSHTLANLATPTASLIDTEQYGLNLVANTVPSIGVGPSGGIGQAASGYDTTDQFKYVSGDVIAEAITYSAQTTFTVSFIANVTSTTPAGDYGTIHTLICTATY